MNKYLSIAPEIQEALAAGKPVVALESTILSHGMPYPENLEFSHRVEEIVREEGAVPATTAIIGGQAVRRTHIRPAGNHVQSGKRWQGQPPGT